MSVGPWSYSPASCKWQWKTSHTPRWSRCSSSVPQSHLEHTSPWIWATDLNPMGRRDRPRYCDRERPTSVIVRAWHTSFSAAPCTPLPTRSSGRSNLAMMRFAGPSSSLASPSATPTCRSSARPDPNERRDSEQQSCGDYRANDELASRCQRRVSASVVDPRATASCSPKPRITAPRSTPDDSIATSVRFFGLVRHNVKRKARADL